MTVRQRKTSPCAADRLRHGLCRVSVVRNTDSLE